MTVQRSGSTAPAAEMVADKEEITTTAAKRRRLIGIMIGSSKVLPKT
jgi:hypothetical protein